jgi:ubiquinone/menaquinone biosynthesis C-methylase UbiE
MFHNLGTLGLDERGRNILVDRTVKENDYVLDAGGGTGITAIKAGDKVGDNGKAVILDLSEKMLGLARKKIEELEMIKKFELKVGDMYQIPYPDETFDTVLSTYSTCPLENPMNAVQEMLRVLKKGGLLGIAHSTDSNNKIAKWISNKIENIIWKFARLSLGCRNISLVNDIRKLDVDIIEEKTIGIIPFFFKILIVMKR